jgi:hypothetical protein
MIAAAERANEVSGEGRPEALFVLGWSYATAIPSRKEQAARLLRSFLKRTCRSRQAKHFKEDCATAQDLLQQLGVP